MADSEETADDFDFDADRENELSTLAEAFIHEELDASLFAELDPAYLEQLVEHGNSEPPAGVDQDEYLAAVEVAELILDRIEAADN